jgi:hypothetical protein
VGIDSNGQTIAADMTPLLAIAADEVLSLGILAVLIQPPRLLAEGLQMHQNPNSLQQESQ